MKHMKHCTFKDLIRIDKLQNIFKRLCDSINMDCCIVDSQGEIIIQEDWYCACEDHSYFLRTLSTQFCMAAKDRIEHSPANGHTEHIFTCRNGYSNAGVPVIIDGLSLGNIFVGPFIIVSREGDSLFLEENHDRRSEDVPDTPPVCSPARVQRIIAQLQFLAEVIVEMGHNYLKERALSNALKDSEIRYRKLFDKSHDGLLLVEEEAIVDCNDKAVEIFQISKSGLTGESLGRLLKQVEPQNRRTI